MYIYQDLPLYIFSVSLRDKRGCNENDPEPREVVKFSQMPFDCLKYVKLMAEKP